MSCNLITLEHVDLVELCEEPSLQNQQDLKKAFYRCDRETVVNEAQRKYGAGEIDQVLVQESHLYAREQLCDPDTWTRA